jgi:DNA invertase Pin-like site-specific DNA recombinase
MAKRTASTTPKTTPADTVPHGIILGYARTSTTDQTAGFEGQQRDLQAAGATKLFAEQVSSVARREQLQAVLDYAREGDTLVVTKLDRLARSTPDLLAIISSLEAKGVALRVLSMGGGEVNTKTPTGRLMLTMLGAVAEFERSLMLERQREGIAKAKSLGRYTGRQPTARRKFADVLQLKAEGLRPVDIAERLGMSRASVYRALSEARG